MSPTEQPIITDRLVVRLWQRADLDAYQAWPPFNDPLLAIFNRPPRSTLELDLEWAGALLNPGQRLWTILTAGQVIGRITLRELPEHSGRLGMLLGSPYVDQGFGSEALRAWLAIYFGHWQMQSLSLQVACWNRRARHLYERTGFSEIQHYWQTVGATADYSFLRSPAYASFAACFRWGLTELYAAWVEMQLTAGQWAVVQESQGS